MSGVVSLVGKCYHGIGDYTYIYIYVYPHIHIHMQYTYVHPHIYIYIYTQCVRWARRGIGRSLLGGSWDLVATYNWASNKIYGLPNWPYVSYPI